MTPNEKALAALMRAIEPGQVLSHEVKYLIKEAIAALSQPTTGEGQHYEQVGWYDPDEPGQVWNMDDHDDDLSEFHSPLYAKMDAFSESEIESQKLGAGLHVPGMSRSSGIIIRDMAFRPTPVGGEGVTVDGITIKEASDILDEFLDCGCNNPDHLMRLVNTALIQSRQGVQQ